MAERKKKRLKANMFGNFSLTYDGRSLLGASRSGESQFAFLMQRLLHAGEAGVPRRDLALHLFGERDVSNMYHSLRNVVYNANKRLDSMGLGDHCITQKKDIYYWTEDIPVDEDARLFEKLFEEAEAEEDEDVKVAKYMEAAHLCQGEFLASQGANIWVAQEAKRYRTMFVYLVENCAELLRARTDYERMAELGMQASRVFPLSDWEAITMEALVAMGRYDDARKLFEDTTDFYLREQGLRPTEKMMELLEQLGDGMGHSYGFLEEIQGGMTEYRSHVDGGYVCNFPVFRGVYRTLSRMVERTGLSVYLMLCTIVDTKGNPMREGPILDRLTARLKEAISQSTRYSDIINQYGPGQYLILLTNTTMENCEVVQSRIDEHFLSVRQRTGVVYHVKAVEGLQDDE